MHAKNEAPRRHGRGTDLPTEPTLHRTAESGSAYLCYLRL